MRDLFLSGDVTTCMAKRSSRSAQLSSRACAEPFELAPDRNPPPGGFGRDLANQQVPGERDHEYDRRVTAVALQFSVPGVRSAEAGRVS